MTKKLNDPSQPDFENATQDDLLITEKNSWDQSKEIAKGEKTDWTSLEELNRQKIRNDIRESWVMGWIVPALMIFLCIFFVIFLGSWSWHFVASDYWQWLEDDQIDKIESTIFSGSLGAVVSIYFQGKIKKKSTVSDTTSQSE